MPKLRRLSGREVLEILAELGFEVRRVKGSHQQLKYTGEESVCFTTVPVHGNKPLAVGTLKSIVRQISKCISQVILDRWFYSD
jgi:predicted RNA binding protein YcfA (HicA-like mRNA interferase family)